MTNKIVKKEQEVAPQKELQPVSVSMETIILQAIEKGIPVETFEKILAMKERVEAAEAKKQFDKAMADAQAEFPEIKKTKKAMDGQKVLYAYAPIDEIVRQVRKPLAENGLSYSIKTEMTEGKVKSICIVRHIAGHSEQSEMEVPLGTKTGIMSNSQHTAAAATFSKRYAFMNAFGIMTGDEDKEEALKVTDDDVAGAKQRLDQCMSIPALKKVWESFPKEIKANKEVIAYTNQIKSNINENSQNGTV